MKKLFLASLLVAIASAVILSGCAAPAPAPTTAPAPAPAAKPAPPIELRFSTTIPVTGPRHIYGHAPWAKMVEDATKGRVKVTIYPMGTLSTAETTYDAVVNGITHIGWFDAAMEPGRFPLTTGVYSLPGAGVVNAEMGAWVLWNLYKKSPELQAEYKDAKILFLHAFAPIVLATKDKIIRSPGDVKGMKLRAAPGGTRDILNLAQATAVTMAPPDIYGSMEKGLLDGNAMGWEGQGAFKIIELCKYFTPVPAFGGPQFLMAINQKTWNIFPADIQQAILSVSGDFGSEHYGRSDDKGSQGVIQQIAALKGQVINLTQQEQQVWNDLAKPLQEKTLADLEAKGLPAKKLWNEMLKLVEEYNKKPK